MTDIEKSKPPKGVASLISTLFENIMKLFKKKKPKDKKEDLYPLW